MSEEALTPLPDPPTEVTLSGTVVVHQEDGSQLDRGSGEFELQIWDGSSSRPESVEVHEGTWSTRVPASAWLSFTQLVIDGRAAIGPNWFERFPIPSNRHFPIHAQWPSSIALRVLGADTGRDLHDVEWVTAAGSWYLGHPGLRRPAGRTTKEATSPVNLPPPTRARSESMRIFVRAAGYAWAPVEVNLRRGGEQAIRLQPSGTLSVSVRGHEPGPNVWLRLQPKNGSLIELRLGSESNDTIESVPVGQYRATYEVGSWPSELKVLATAEVVVEHGLTSALELLVPEQEPVVRVPLSGTVVVPRAWDEPFGISARRLHPPGARHAPPVVRHEDLIPLSQADTWRWNLGLVEPGRYAISVFPLPHSTVVEVGDEGLTDVQLEVPPPATVAIRILDEGDRPPLQPLAWSVASPGGRGGSTVPRPDGTFQFVAPVGRISVTLDSRVYFGQSSEFEVKPGMNEIEIVGRRSCGILVWPEEDGTRLPFESSGLVVSVKDAKSSAPVFGWSSDGHARRFHVPRPGTYRLSFRGIEGYLPIADQEVTVEAERYTECRVNLTRAE